MKKAIAESYTKEELLEKQYNRKLREKIISRTRSAVVRSQLVRAYEVLENIRFDHVSDTGFRDKITSAKQAIERAVNDFLMSDGYWEKRIKAFQKLSLEEYKKSLK